MTEYTIYPHNEGFSIEVVNKNGSRHTMLGFDSTEAAEEWIVSDKLREVYEYKPVILDDLRKD